MHCNAGSLNAYHRRMNVPAPLASNESGVLIVGGGLVGASLAIALDAAGIAATLVEAAAPRADAQPSYDERNLALARATVNGLDAIGVWRHAAAQATPAGALVTAIQTDPATAKKQYARGLGLGDAYYYFLTGQGRIVAITDDGVQLNLTGGTNVEVSLQTGLIFGNALRDGCGLLRVSDYPNSQDFNAIAEALNHLAETQVLPTLTNQAKVGMNLSFSGCAEVDDESADLKPLKVIPLLTRPQ